ncbi:CheR family methyltransferase [Cohnella sp. JJ-181]|uniref:CheR family methyltransferase n=1 Tax=Cohnella rhizoplanae TaxID=2974897 RepID=UPI0022FF5A09|nr:protein-glutamate O-methyltransferase CheR [Cohnella sp. JJ-181]CAI6075014.1 Chemotaxis protein methyltransferase [Cohnella sp. JJ-181]
MAAATAGDLDFAQFVNKLRSRTGIDLLQYKEDQMRRRLATFRDRRGYRTFCELYEGMVRDAELYEEFLDRMTINVSEFYRNARRWEVLAQKIVPELTATRGKLRCWSAACSTGDEPYTLSIVLSGLLRRHEYEVLATDIDKGALERAREGVYGAASVREVPKPILDRHFKARGDTYAVSEEIKRSVAFKQHNLLADPYENGFDLIVCRNVLIYFTDEAKDSVFRSFSKSLSQGGYLFIGGTEQVFQPDRYGLETADAFFYRKT